MAAWFCSTRVEVDAPSAYFFCSASRDCRARSTAAWAEATLARFCCTPNCALRTSIRTWFSICRRRNWACRYSNSDRTCVACGAIAEGDIERDARAFVGSAGIDELVQRATVADWADRGCGATKWWRDR